MDSKYIFEVGISAFIPIYLVYWRIAALFKAIISHIRQDFSGRVYYYCGKSHIGYQTIVSIYIYDIIIYLELP